MFDTLQLESLLARLGTYSFWQVAFELALIWIVVYGIVRFVEGTRAAGALKGLLVVLVVATVLIRVLGGSDAFERLTYLYDRFLAVIAVGLVVIFQPELRRALIRLGEAPLFRSSPKEIATVVEQVADACALLSKQRFGAIIVFEGSIGLEGLVEGGTKLNADCTSRLMQTIFYPGSALHDLAVLIRGSRIAAANVQLPLADPSDMPDPSFGSRHRAAVGLTRECDALVVVVSEETGHIRLAQRGKLSRPMDAEALRADLLGRFERSRKESAAAEPAATPKDDSVDPTSEAPEEHETRMTNPT